ncbi:hypothetical protein EON67_10260, partial [archaeon]
MHREEGDDSGMVHTQAPVTRRRPTSHDHAAALSEADAATAVPTDLPLYKPGSAHVPSAPLHDGGSGRTTSTVPLTASRASIDACVHLSEWLARGAVTPLISHEYLERMLEEGGPGTIAGGFMNTMTNGSLASALWSGPGMQALGVQQTLGIVGDQIRELRSLVRVLLDGV